MSSFIQRGCYGCGGPLDGLLCRQCTCKCCGNNLRDGFCSFCNSRAGNSFTYDSNPNFFDNPPNYSYHPPHPTYKTYSCESCGNDSHFGYDCPPRFPLNYEPEPGYIQNYNSYPHDSPKYLDEIKIDELKGNFNSMSIEINKKEKLLQLEQLANLSTYPSKRFNSFCYDDDDDDDEDYTIAVTPNEFIKSSVENLIPIPSESLGIPDNMCDVPFHDNSLPLDVSKDQFEDFSDSNDEFSSTNDDSFSIDNIEYVEASPPDSEFVSSEVMEIVISEVGGIDDDILLTIKDDILCEKLLNINLLIAKIKALNDNPTPSSDFMTKSSSTSLNSLLEETNPFDNSLSEFETFCFDVEEISSGSTTTRSDISLLEYEVFYDDHVKEISSGSTTTHSDSSLYDSFIFDLSVNLFPPADMSDFYEFADELTHIYLHQSMIVSSSRLNPTRGISPWMWWRIFLQQENQEFIMLSPPIPPFN
nr:hypothetical protein [Tanacetum cinerariifolium]